MLDVSYSYANTPIINCFRLCFFMGFWGLRGATESLFGLWVSLFTSILVAIASLTECLEGSVLYLFGF